MSKISRFYILLCWTVVILILISFPMPEYEGTKITIYDKLVHAFLFGVFSYLIIYSLILFRSKNFKLSFIMLISFLAGAIYAGIGEYIQTFVPGRTVSEYDFLGGLAGILISLIVSYGIFKREKA
ncbi:hypothetical protein DRH27_00975 [Candidatus Falkowbacteria bacterium]|nr:MAG: hypothetical protein DRH27_00975 [Candidatus Falkowbacteria bacterium]